MGHPARFFCQIRLAWTRDGSRVVMNLNDRGEIVGWSVVNGETHAILWTIK